MKSAYGELEEYYGKCGELFITVKGNIAFHCTLCENRYKNFQEYNEHILETHYAPDFKEELTAEFIHEDDNSFDPLSEEDYTIDTEELIVREDEIESYESLKEIDKTPSAALNRGYSDNQVDSKSSKKDTIRTQLKCINVKSTIKDRKYKCPHCSFTGASKSNMYGHIRRHSIHKPHQCTECTKTFYTRTELKTHLRSHTGERPFLCTLCGCTFITASSLSSHQKRHYNIRDKECLVCKMRFFDLVALRSHMVVHSEKRDYKCDRCDASFKTHMDLKNHTKLHENRRKYQCKLCDAKFNQNAGLYSHMKNCHIVVKNSSKMSSENELED